MMQLTFDQFGKQPESSYDRLMTARKERDVGMTRAAEKAERNDPTFSERARDFVLTYLANNGDTSGETIVIEAVKAGIKPRDERAFGPVFAVLARRQQIHKVGSCIRLKGHASEGGKVWGLHAK